MTTTTNRITSLPLPPGNLGLPFIGETIGFLKDPEFMEKRHNKYGQIFKTRLFGASTIVVIGPEANRFVLTNNDYFAISWPLSVKTLLGPNSLSLQEGSQHQSRRKLLSYAFQPKALAGYLPFMEKITLSYLQKWESMGKLTWYPELRNYTFDVASSLLVGTESGSQTPMAKLFKDWCDGLFSIPIPLPGTKFGRALQCRKELLAYIEEIVLRRQAAQEPGEDALGLMLQARDEEGQGLSLPELKDQVLLLLFAGHETLTSALGTLCMCLAQHPEVREKLRAEVRQMAPNGLSAENLKQMIYLEMVIKEVLRLVAPVGGGFRKAIKSCEYNGYSIPEGWGILYQIARTHEDSSTYIQPEQFNPERFSPERSDDKQKPFSYLPFGGGMRECLGKAFAQLVMKVFAAQLVYHHTWELLPGQNLDLVRVPTPHPKDGLKVSFQRL